VDLSTNRFLRTALVALALTATAPAATGVAAGVPEPEVTCAACILVDDTGRVLFAREADIERPNASTTKMVTAMVAFARADPEEIVTVSSRAAATGGGGLDLQPGDKYAVGPLLYALLLSSSNDAAVALAEHTAGSEASFVAAMNAFARRLEARHTHFVNAHGLDATGHYSSARDLARIAAALLRRSFLAEIVATPRTTIPAPGGSLQIENRNVLLESYPGAVGVKTGYTAGAGDTLVAAARRHHRLLVAVAMGSASAATDDAALLDYGWARLARGILVESAAPVGELVFGYGSTPVNAARTLRGPEHPARVSVRFVPDDELTLPVEAGERVGTAVLTIGRREIGEVDALAGAEVGADDQSLAARIMSAVIGSSARVLETVGAL
jgi:serine-type D-Ala-D-Ala carboxypeptidase (penicillin-binding protein 5/6)